MVPNGSFVVTWNSYGPDGSAWDVYARLFRCRRQAHRPGGACQLDGGAQPASSSGGDGNRRIVRRGLGQLRQKRRWPRECSASSSRRRATGSVPSFRSTRARVGAEAVPAVAIAPDGATLVAWITTAGSATNPSSAPDCSNEPSPTRTRTTTASPDPLDNCPTVPDLDPDDAQADGFGDACVSPRRDPPARRAHRSQPDHRPRHETWAAASSSVTTSPSVSRRHSGRWWSWAPDRPLEVSPPSAGVSASARTWPSARARVSIRACTIGDAVVGERAALRRGTSSSGRTPSSSRWSSSWPARGSARARASRPAPGSGRGANVLPGAVVPAGTGGPAGATVP